MKKFFNHNLINAFFLILIIISVLFAYHFPDFFAFINTPKGMVYLGQNSYFDPWDVNIYVSTIHHGQWGGILLPNLYTTLVNKPIVIYSLLTIIGFIFRNTNQFLLFNVYSIMTGIFLILGLFYLIKKLGLSTQLSLFSVLIICLGGGVGFIGLGKIFSSDINNSAFTFYGTFQKPHEAIAILCYIAALILCYRLITNNYSKIYNLFHIIVCLTITLFIYPYFFATFFLIIITFLFFYKRTTFLSLKDYVYLVILGIPSWAIVLFISNQFYINPTFANVQQNIGIDFVSMLLGFGILIPIFIYQLFYLPKSYLKTFLSLWFIVTFFLSILPFGPGRIFFRGSFFPIVLLSVLALNYMTKGMGKIGRYSIFLLFGILLIGSSVYIFFVRLANSTHEGNFIYMMQDEYAVFQFLNVNTPQNSGVLTLYTLGNQIPAFTYNRVYIGHVLQTPDAQNKLQSASIFYSGLYPVNEQLTFLKQNNISFVIFGPEEKKFYNKYAQKGNSLMDTFQALKIVYKNNLISVYSVPR